MSKHEMSASDTNRAFTISPYVEIEILQGSHRLAEGTSPTERVIRLSAVDWARAQRARASFWLGDSGYTVIHAIGSKEIALGRWVMAPDGERLPPGIVADHIYRNVRDNRRESLRLVSSRVNYLNSLQSQHEIGRIPGIQYDLRKQLWIARFRSRGSITPLGEFQTEAEAQAAVSEVIGKREDALLELIRDVYQKKGIPETSRNVIRWADLQPVHPIDTLGEVAA